VPALLDQQSLVCGRGGRREVEEEEGREGDVKGVWSSIKARRRRQ
jgi:hypothetical protein